MASLKNVGHCELLPKLNQEVTIANRSEATSHPANAVNQPNASNILPHNHVCPGSSVGGENN